MSAKLKTPGVEDGDDGVIIIRVPPDLHRDWPADSRLRVRDTEHGVDQCALASSRITYGEQVKAPQSSERGRDLVIDPGLDGLKRRQKCIKIKGIAHVRPRSRFLGHRSSLCRASARR